MSRYLDRARIKASFWFRQAAVEQDEPGIPFLELASVLSLVSSVEPRDGNTYPPLRPTKRGRELERDSNTCSERVANISRILSLLVRGKQRFKSFARAKIFLIFIFPYFKTPFWDGIRWKKVSNIVESYPIC